MSDPFVEVVEEASIRSRVEELGAEIAADYEGRDIVLVGVLTGSLMFTADLVRSLSPRTEVEFLSLSRFGDGGRVRIAMDVATPLAGRHVVLVEDIVDTGLTLTTLRRMLEIRGVASLTTVALLDKVSRRIVQVPIEYRGFEVGDEFLLGYGLDWEGRYRNVPSLWAVLDLVRFQQDPDALARLVFGRASDSVAP